MWSIGQAALGRPAAERTHHGIEHEVEVLAHVVGHKAKHEVVILLEQPILASIPAVRHGVREVVGAVELDRNTRIGGEHVDLELALAIK